jgi:hypothetical protein
MAETTTPDQRDTSDAASWAAIALLTLAVAGCEWLRPLPISPASLTGLAIACGALLGAATFYRTARPRENFSVMCIALAQVILFSAVGIILSYLLARGDGPLWDTRLAQWDAAFGFDWRTYVHWVDASPLLTGVLHIAYGSLIPQIVMLVLALGFTFRLAELRSVMLAAIVCGTICILVSAFFPAISNPATFGLTARDFRHVDPWAGYVHLKDLMALRDGSFSELRLGEMQGIITFPSYHAGLSLVTLWGFWASRMAWLRWPGMTIAALTIAATPVDGGHYLVDVLAGLAIAAASIVIAVRAIRWTPALPRLTAWPFRHSHAASGQ